MVVSMVKILVHHPIESIIFSNGWPSGFRLGSEMDIFLGYERGGWIRWITLNFCTYIFYVLYIHTITYLAFFCDHFGMVK